MTEQHSQTTEIQRNLVKIDRRLKKPNLAAYIKEALLANRQCVLAGEVDTYELSLILRKIDRSIRGW
jgi:hypothetical protein